MTGAGSAAGAVQYVTDESTTKTFAGRAAEDDASGRSADRDSYESLVGGLLQQFNQGRGFEQLLDSVYEELRTVVPYNRIAVAIFEDVPARLRLISCRSDGDVSLKIGYASRIAGSTLGPLLNSGHARIINDLEAYYDEKPHSSSTRLILSEGMRSNLTLPLVADGKPIGVVFFSSRDKHVYTRDHATLLRRLAGHIAISVEKARWIEELKESNAQLAEANRDKDQYLDSLQFEVDRQTQQLRVSERRYRLLVRLGQLVNSSLNVREVFESAAIESRKLLGCDLITLRLVGSGDAGDSGTNGVAREGASSGSLAIEFPRDRPAVGPQWADFPQPASPQPMSRPNAPMSPPIAQGVRWSEGPRWFELSVPVTDDAIVGDAITGDAITGDAITGDAIAGDAITGDAIAGDAIAGDGANVFDGAEIEWLAGRGYARYGLWPLVSRGRLLGWLGIATRQAADADSWDLELIGEMASQLAVAIDNASAYGKIDRLKRQLEQQNVYLREEIRTDQNFSDIVGTARPMQQLRSAIRQVAGTDSTVLILGETGTGKELIARAIHDQSPRRDKLMVKVNCAALAPALITSELFGHESGAFTGATGLRIGRFELADGGTIFLDEISEMPLETQVLLLRVLQERVFERVGGSTPIPVNARVIAATNRDLKALSDEGKFRGDLFYRLHVFPIRVPPLRERREDIAALIDHFVRRFSERMNKHITRVPRQTMELLVRYDWPGNVRELENLIERATIVSPGDSLVIDASWLAGGIAGQADGGVRPAIGAAGQSLAEIDRQAILEALRQRSGKVYGPDGAAALLGLKPTTLYGKMRKLGIKIERRSADPSD